MKAGWESTTVGNLSEVVTKGTTPTSVGHKFTETGINFIKVESLGEHGQFIANKLSHISEDCHETLRRSQIKEGDILFSIAGALGRTAVVPSDIVPANTNQALSIIRLKNDALIHRPFLVYALSSGMLIEQIEKARGGVAQQNLSLAQVKAFNIPLPPLEEQQRIVAVLDEAFEGLARARAHAEANLKNARELFESELNAALEDLSDQHGVRSLGSVSDFRNGFAFKSARFKPSGEPVVRISNIQDGEIDETKMVFTDPDDYSEDLTRYAVQPNDLLIAMSGATTGKVGFNNTGKVLLQNQRVGRFCPTEKLDLRFLYYFLSTKVAEHLSISAGAAQPNLSTKQINEIEVPVPPLGVQVDFLRKIEILKDSVGALKDNYGNCLQDLEDLRQSLLQKAFAGELT